MVRQAANIHRGALEKASSGASREQPDLADKTLATHDRFLRMMCGGSILPTTEPPRFMRGMSRLREAGGNPYAGESPFRRAGRQAGVADGWSVSR